METRKDASQLLWGIVLVALGLLFLAGNFGYRTWFAWDRWWPLLLIAIGVILLYRHRAEEAAPIPPGPPLVPPGTPPVSPGTAPPEAPPGPDRPAVEGKRSPTGAIILIGVGAAFLLDEWVGGNAFPAFLLIAIGVALLLRQRAAS